MKKILRACTDCKEELALSSDNFHRVNGKSTASKRFQGYTFRCKQCDSKRIRLESARRRVLRHIKRHPERNEARKIMQTAIKNKELIRQPCEKCGDEKTQGHHPDYSKPLDIIWLCKRHHVEEHYPPNNNKDE